MPLSVPSADRPPAGERTGRAHRSVVTGAALLAAFGATLALCGHVFDVPLLVTPLSAVRPISFSSALAALILALVVLFAAPARPRAVMAGTGIALLIAVTEALRLAGILNAGSAQFIPMSPISVFVYGQLAVALLLFAASRRIGTQALGAGAVVGLVVSLGALAYYLRWLPVSGREPVLLSLPLYAIVLQLLLSAACATLFLVHAARHFTKRTLSAPARVGTPLAIVCLGVAWTAVVWKDDTNLRANAKQTISGLARVLEEHLYRSMDPVDMLLQAMEARIQSRGVAAVAASADELQRAREAVSTLPQLLSIAILDAQGNLRLLSSPNASNRVNFASRDYFEAHRAGHERHLGRIIQAAAGPLAFSYSHRLEDAQGRFAGVLVAGMNADYFVDFYRSLELDHDTSVMLVRNDGLPLVRTPMLPDLLDADLSAFEPFSGPMKAPHAGSYVGRSPFSDEPGMVAYRTSAALPVTVAAAREVDSLVNQFETRYALSGLFLAVALTLIVANTYRQALTAAHDTEAREALRQREARLRQLTREVPAVLFEWYVRPNGENGFHYLSPRVRDLFGIDAASLLKDWRGLPIHPDDADKFISSVESVIAERRPEWLFEGRLLRPDGRIHWTRSHSTLTSTNGNELVYTGVMIDVTEEKARTDALAESEKRLNLITAHIPALVAYVDADLRFRFANAAYREWFGIDEAQMIGRRLDEIADRAERYGTIEPYLRRALSGERVAFEHEDRHEGRTRHLFATYIPDHKDDKVVGLYTFVTDVTAQKELELYLTRQAMHDGLTGLPNRVAIHEEIRRAIDRTARSGQPMAVLFLDLNRFKQVNDTLGHDAGDALLRTVAQRLRDTVRKTDTVARLAGDEFVVLLENLGGGEADAQHIVNKLMQAMQAPAMIGGHKVSISASIGVTVHTGGAATAAELLKQSDSAMYRVKNTRTNT